MLDIQKNIIKANFKRSSKALGKLDEEDIKEGNKQFFYFLNYVSCKGQNKAELAETWLTKLKSTKRFENYITKAEQLLKEEF